MTARSTGTEDAAIDDPLVEPTDLRHREGSWSVRTSRPDPRVTLFDVRLSDYHEYFFVAVGDKSISITMFDPSDETHLEPQTFTFAKPYGWQMDLDDEEALLQVWQAVGVQR